MINDQLPYVKTGDAIKAEHINAIVKGLKSRTPRPSDTVSIRQTANGFVMDAATGGNGGNGFIHAWKPRLSRQEGTTDYIIVYPGVFGGEIPNIGGEFLYDEPELAITGANENGKYVYIHASLSLTITDGFINGYTLNDVEVQAFSTQQTNDDSNFYHLLFSWSRNRVVQYSYWSQGFVARDDGTATETPMYYSWAV